MLSELRRYSDELSDVSNFYPEHSNSLELLKIETQLAKSHRSILDALFEKIMPLTKEAKKELIIYCIHYLNHEMHLSRGIPWWAFHLHSRWNRKSYGTHDFALYLGVPHDRLKEVLSELAKQCESDYYRECNWPAVFKALDSTSGYSFDTLDSDDEKRLSAQLIDESTFCWCAEDTAARIHHWTIQELSKLYSYFSYGSPDGYPLSPNAKWSDHMTDLCNEILTVSNPEKLTELSQNLITATREILVIRKQDIDVWFKNMENPPAPVIVNTASIPAPLTWQGKGTELLDLFVTLQEKGFIQLPGSSVMPGPTWEAVCKAICGLFDLSKFRRADSKGEPWQTLETYFKSRSEDRLTREQRYDRLNYDKRRFKDIQPPASDLPELS